MPKQNSISTNNNIKADNENKLKQNNTEIKLDQNKMSVNNNIENDTEIKLDQNKIGVNNNNIENDTEIILNQNKIGVNKGTEIKLDQNKIGVNEEKESESETKIILEKTFNKKVKNEYYVNNNFNNNINFYRFGFPNSNTYKSIDNNNHYN